MAVFCGFYFRLTNFGRRRKWFLECLVFSCWLRGVVFCYTLKKIFSEKFGGIKNFTLFYTMKQQATEYYTTKEVQALLKVSRVTLHRWRKAKLIKAKKFQGVVRYKLSDIEKVMK